MTAPEAGSARVVAGFDGRWQDPSFVQVAAREAERRQLPLSVVTVLRRHGDLDRGPRGIQADDPYSAAAARSSLHATVTALRLSFPRLDVRSHCMSEDEVRADRYPLNAAELLVIGFRGRFRQAALRLESISTALLAAARCPVLVVPEGAEPSGSTAARPARPFVLAAIGDRPHDAGVVQAALHEAERRDCDLKLLHVSVPLPGGTARTPAPGARETLDKIIAASGVSSPRMSVLLTSGDPAGTLILHSAQAAVLVVGRQDEPLAELRKGSISGLMQQATCPVLVIPRSTWHEVLSTA